MSAESTEHNVVPKEEDTEMPLSYGVLPVPRVDRSIRKLHAGRRVSPGVAIYTTHALENIFLEVLRTSQQEAVASKKKRITKANLIAAVRTHPSLRRFFSSYMFSDGIGIQYKASDLMTKKDKHAHAKARLGKKHNVSTTETTEIPGVDED